MKNSTSIVTVNETTQRDLNDEVEIKSGDYWLKAGTQDDIRLISSLNIIDDILHSLVIEANPRDMWERDNCHKGNSSLTVEEFLKEFEPINQDLAQSIRKKDAEKLQEKMQQISLELANGYVDNNGVSSTERLTHISEQNKSDMSLPIAMANEKSLSTIKNQTEEIKSIVVKQKDFISVKTNEMTIVSKNLTAIYKEQASKSLASVEGTMKFIARLEKSIHTLDIFTGEGVESYQLSKGKQASDDEKISFYQRKLYLDEEFFYDLANGGADYSSLEAFKKALAKDINVIKNMLPNEKSVVLMQFRRNERISYFGSDEVSMADVLHRAWEREQNEEVFLFIRNGENVYAIFSDDMAHGKRLFPTETEIKSIFKKEGKFDGIEVDKYLSFKELANKKARDEMDNTSLYYKRLLTLLFGLHERDNNIFGENLKGNWFSKEFQNQNFIFIHDDEDGLDYDSKSLSQFVKEKNTSLQVGSRVIAEWRGIMDEDNASGMYSNSMYHEDQQIWLPIYTQEPQIVKQVNGKLCCYIECSHHWDSKTKRIKVEINPNDDIFVIDNIKAEEIEFYFRSRKYRTQYAKFAIMMVGIRNLLKKEEEEAQPSVDYLYAHIKALFPDMEKEYIDKNLFESVSFWKVKNKGIALPNLALVKNEKTLKEIANIFFNKTINNKTELLKEYCKTNIKNPVALSTDNKGKYFVYSEVDKSEYVEFGAFVHYPFVKQTILKIVKNEFKEVSNKQVMYGIYSKNEELIYEFKKLELEQSKYNKNLDTRFLDSLEMLKNNIALSNEFFQKLINEENVDNVLKLMFDNKCDIQHKHRFEKKGRYILDYNISILVDLWLVDKSDSKYHEMHYKNFLIVTQGTNLNMLIARYGSNELYNECENWILEHYSNPNQEINTLAHIRRDKKHIFNLVKTPIFFTNNHVIERKKLDFGVALVNKKRYHNFPIHTSLKNEEKAKFDYEEYIKEEYNGIVNKDKCDKHIYKRIEIL